VTYEVTHFFSWTFLRQRLLCIRACVFWRCHCTLMWVCCSWLSFSERANARVFVCCRFLLCKCHYKGEVTQACVQSSLLPARDTSAAIPAQRLSANGLEY
uniref:Secreted protein n=1 Tax=Parascaris univalens TaxID=6257 RepID=A0A915CJV4_PARUN